MLKEIFASLAANYCDDTALVHDMWVEIEKSHSAKSRHYHNLKHLQNMYQELFAVRDQVAEWDVTLFSVFYHDIVYKATAKDNEEQSAALAGKRLSAIHFPAVGILKCQQLILATKQHNAVNDSDTNYFLDADMAILGSDWDAYKQYFTNIRKEYAIYPDFLYNPGRVKVLNQFLLTDYIFGTRNFRDKYELAARTNIKKELEHLL